jgi:O-antigen/teichoic acid export membrane protein
MSARPRFLARWFQDGSLARLFRHCLELIVGDVGANALQVLSLALTTRALGLEAFSLLVLIQTYTAVVDELVTFQSWKAMIRFGAAYAGADQRERLAGVFKVGLLLDLGSALVATLLSIAGSFVLARWKGLDGTTTAMLVVNSLGTLTSLTGLPTAALRLFERFRMFSLQKTLAALIKLVGVGVAYASGAGLWGFLIATLVATVAGRVTLFVSGWRVLTANGLGGFLRAPATEARAITRFSIWTNLITTVSLPIKHFDMLLVKELVSLESVGVYKLIKQIALVMTMVSDSVYQVIYPRLAGLIARSEFSAALVQAIRTGALLFAFTALASVGVALLGPALIPFFFGPEFARDFASLDAYMFLRAVSCAFVVVHPLFLALGFVKRELAILIAANSLYLAAAWMLGTHWGLFGIVLAYGVQFTSVLVPKILIIRAELRGRDKGSVVTGG